MIENIIKDIEEQISDFERFGKDMDYASWGYDDGVLLSGNAATKIIEHIKQLEADAARYKYLRDRDLDAIAKGGLFAWMTPDNVVVNGDDLDVEIDKITHAFKAE